MGKISNVFYYEVPSEICSIEEASRYNLLQNLLGESFIYDEEYERYEEKQMKLKNTLIGEAVKKEEITNPKVSTTLFGTSSIHNKCIIVTEI